MWNKCLYRRERTQTNFYVVTYIVPQFKALHEGYFGEVTDCHIAHPIDFGEASDHHSASQIEDAFEPFQGRSGLPMLKKLSTCNCVIYGLNIDCNIPKCSEFNFPLINAVFDSVAHCTRL